MKSEIYSSEFVEFEFDTETSIMYERWTEVEHDEEVYKNEITKKCALLREYKPKLFVDDVSQTNFTIVPELQEWTEGMVGPALVEVGVSKYALIVPEDLFAQVSLDQTVDEVKMTEAPVEFEYFEELKDAENWLLS